jgi:hypothetical protein
MSETTIANLLPGTEAYANANDNERFLSDWLREESGEEDPVERACSFEDVLLMIKEYAPEKLNEMLGYTDQLGVWSFSSCQETQHNLEVVRETVVIYKCDLMTDEATKKALIQVIEIYKDKVAELVNITSLS